MGNPDDRASWISRAVSAEKKSSAVGPVELNTGVIITREGNKGSGVSVGLSPIAKAPW